MKKLGGKKLIVLAPLILVVLAAVALAVLPMLGINLPVRVQLQTGDKVAASALDPSKGTETPEAQKDAPERRFSMVYSTGERVLNLADPGAFRYLKIEVVLELASDVDPEKVKGDAYAKAEEELKATLAPKLPAIEDAITSVVTAKTVADISAPDGKEALKSELKARLAELLPGEEIKSIYFTQFIFQ